MKSIALSLLLLAFGALSSNGQGQINFFTFNGNTAFGQVYLPGTTESVTSAFSGQIALSTSMGGVFTVVGSVGDFAGGGGVNPSAINVGVITVAGFNAGTDVYYKLLVWNDAAGANFDDASVSPSGIVGSSDPILITLGGIPPVGDPVNPPTVNGFTSFALTAVPEPSVIALGLLGAAAVILRRRKV